MTINKEKKPCFDIDELLKERELVDLEVNIEISGEQKSFAPHIEIGDKMAFRTHSLLLTNYIENLIKDCIVIINKSHEARKIPRDTINKILYDRNYVDENTFNDVKRIFKIRDQFGHTLKMSSIEKRIEPIIDQMSFLSESQYGPTTRGHLKDNRIECGGSIYLTMFGVNLKIITRLKDSLNVIIKDHRQELQKKST